MRTYEIDQCLGRGSMGEVYRARHRGLDRWVAIKFLQGALADHPEFQERFLREARLCARLEHPGIVRVLDVAMDEGRPYLVMELLEGENLYRRIKRSPLPQEEAIRIADRVLEALAYAHRQGVVHRDIKPGNIHLCAAGGVKVMDFGIAKVAGEVSLTTTGMPMGTPEYMSPEQVEGASADARADLYALAVVLYEMLTGDVPFRADTPLVVMRMQMEKPPPSLPDWVWPGLRALVARALSKDPAQRYPSAEAMRQALAGARDADPVAHAASERVTTAWKSPVAPAAAPKPPRHGSALALGGAALALIVGLSLYAQRPQPSANPAPPAIRTTATTGQTEMTIPETAGAGASSPIPSTPVPTEPRTAEEWNQRGWTEYRRNRHAAAADAWRQALRLAPEEAAYHNRLGNALREQKQWSGAADAYTAAVRRAPDKAPDKPAYCYNLSTVLYKQEMWPAAEQAVRQALALKPENALYHNRLGQTLRNQGRSEDAAREFYAATQRDPGKPVYWDNLGEMMELLGQLPAAEEAYARAADRELPESEYGQKLRGKLAAIRERIQGAR